MFPRYFFGLEDAITGCYFGTNRVDEIRISPRLEIAARCEIGRIDRSGFVDFAACQLRAGTIVTSGDADKIFTILGRYPNGHHGWTLIVGDHIREDNRRAKQASAKHDLSESINLGIGVFLVNGRDGSEIGNDITEILVIEVLK
jgi:hypothetical protein